MYLILEAINYYYNKDCCESRSNCRQNCNQCLKCHKLQARIWSLFLSVKNCSLEVFSKCHCHCHFLCLFVRQVMSTHHSDQMSLRSQVSWVTLWQSMACLMFQKSKVAQSLTLSVSDWQGHLLSCQTPLWTGKKEMIATLNWNILSWFCIALCQ